jgi:rhodanese-related sulfurtransferase
MLKEQTVATRISTIEPEQLPAAQLRGDQPALLDARTAAEYLTGHIPGAQLLPIREPGPDEVTRWFRHAAPGHQANTKETTP